MWTLQGRAAHPKRHACHLSCSWGSRWGEEGKLALRLSPAPGLRPAVVTLEQGKGEPTAGTARVAGDTAGPSPRSSYSSGNRPSTNKEMDPSGKYLGKGHFGRQVGKYKVLRTECVLYFKGAAGRPRGCLPGTRGLARGRREFSESTALSQGLGGAVATTSEFI